MAMSDDPAGRALAQLAAIVAASDDSIVSVTPEGLVATWNAGAERGYGYSAQEMVGRPVNVLAPHDRVEEADQLLARALRGESVRGFETVRVCKDGCSIPVSLTLSPIRDVSGAVAGVSTIAHDISAQKRMENQLRAKNEELARQNRRVEEANRAKNEFLANMSHELRSPLNGIIGFAELMHDGKLGPVSDQHKEYLGDILSSGKHLLQLINDVLDLAKVEAGRIGFRPEPATLSRLVREVAYVLRAIAAGKGVAIESDVPPDLDAVTLDPARFKQVLYNYLSNALKFTPEGGRVAVRIRPEGEASFRLEVQDNGIGIPEGEIPKLFTQFHQVDHSDARRYSGSGLGLVLTRRIVEAQGGRVGVESELGAGSLFHATLPRIAHRAPSARRSAAAGSPSKEVLFPCR